MAAKNGAPRRRSIAELEAELERRTAECDEALAREAATAEVLQVINSSPGDLAPVFEAMLERATRLCGASVGSFWSYDSQAFQVHASTIGDIGRRMQPGPDTALWRIAHGESVVQIADVETERAYRTDAVGQARTRLAGTRASLAVALRKDETLVGAITTGRHEVRPFSDKEIALLQNFAAQAVIAMENVRLITETREALEQQTATAEILEVINRSPGDLAPVFDAILERAHSLCGAAKGSLVAYDGEAFRTVAARGLSADYAALLRTSQHDLPGSPPQRLLDGESLVEIPDMTALPFPIPKAAAEREGARTVLYVPLRKDDTLLGYITAYRQEVRPFSDKQIALLQNFAAQAVIAMENARLITETREALEQQTATAEVLRVISGSATDVQPVFEAITVRAAKLCEAE